MAIHNTSHFNTIDETENNNKHNIQEQIKKIKELSINQTSFISALITLLKLEGNNTKKHVLQNTLLEEIKKIPHNNILQELLEKTQQLPNNTQEDFIFKLQLLRSFGLTTQEALDYIKRNNFIINIAKKAKNHIYQCTTEEKQHIETILQQLQSDGTLPNALPIDNTGRHSTLIQNYKIIWKTHNDNTIDILDIQPKYTKTI